MLKATNNDQNVILGLLITGGEPEATNIKTELYDLSSNTSCKMPDLPEQRYSHSSHNEGLICGGRLSSLTIGTCIKLINGVWTNTHNLISGRAEHSSWDIDPGNSFMLLGGVQENYEATKTTEIVFFNGSVASGFNLQYFAR